MSISVKTLGWTQVSLVTRLSLPPPPPTHTHTHTPLMSMPTEAKGGRLGDWNASKLAELVLVDLLPLNSLLWK